jgi:hypothetical protein
VLAELANVSNSFGVSASKQYHAIDMNKWYREAHLRDDDAGMIDNFEPASTP